MKMFGFFRDKISKTAWDRADNSVARRHSIEAIDKDSKESRKLIKENRKMLKAKRLDSREAVAMKFGAFKRNVKNLFRYDDQKISDADMRDSISQKYEAKRKAAGIDKHVASDAKRTSRKEIYKNIRQESSQLGKNHLKTSWVNLKHDLKEDRLSFKQSFFEAAGLITAPAKYAKDGVVKGAKAVSQKVTQVKRGTKAGAIKFIRSAGVRYEGGDKLPRKFMEALGAKVSQSKIGLAIGASLKAVKNTALEARGRYADKALNRQQNRQEKLQRWAAARPVRE